MKQVFVAAALAASLLTASALRAEDAPPQSDLAQTQLTDEQVQQYIEAAPDIQSVMSSAPEQQSDAPDAKMVAKLEDIAKKHKFAKYGDLETVAGNIMLVLEGVDPQTKKYIGAEAEIKKEIAALQANKQISAEDKKSEIAELQNELKSAIKVKFKGNIDLVLKYYDKLATEEPAQK